MKRAGYVTWIFVFCIACVVGMSCDALAAEAGSGWRATYDSILRWVNFAILAFVIIKFARIPLKNFAQGQKEKVTRELRRKEEEKEAAVDAAKEIRQTLNDSEARFAALKDRIVEEGERKKQQLVEDARAQSRQMLAEAERKVKNQILQAKKRIKSELTDAAIDLAMEKLPKMITKEDNQKFVDQFLSHTASK